METPKKRKTKAVSVPKEKRSITPETARHADGIITSMLQTFIRGKVNGRTRAAQLVENLWSLATSSEDVRVRLAATKEILDRVDGKVIERKEIKSMKIEGIIYLPEPEEVNETKFAIAGSRAN